jgi:hypothetical protein
MRKLSSRLPSPAMVVACIALLVALGGTSGAAVSNVPNNSVGTNKIKSGAVTTPKLKNNAVTAPKIAANAVVAAKIAGNAVGGAKIAANAVTGAKVADGSLAAADLAAGTIPTSNAFGRFNNGPVVVPTAPAELTNLSIPQAGSYVVSAKAVFSSGGSNTVTCRLEALPDVDESQTTVGASSPQTISNLVVHTFAAAGSVSFRCSRDGLLATSASNIKVVAISVGNLTNTG